MMTPRLQCDGLAAGYAGHPMVQDISITVHEGEIVGLFGANGAGKSTTLLALAGDVDTYGGSVCIDGKEVKGGLTSRARRGLCLVPEERSVFKRLTVAENLKVGRCDEKMALGVFPELGPLLKKRAGLLSGGEQQMLTVARALARRPRVLLTDELSLGLAPLAVKRLMVAIRQAADEHGVGILLVEQHVREALTIVDTAHVLQRGRLTVSGSKAEMRERLGDLENAYLALDTQQ